MSKSGKRLHKNLPIGRFLFSRKLKFVEEEEVLALLLRAGQ